MLPINRDNTSSRHDSAAQAIAAFMNRVYLWMMVGITITGVTAYVVAGRPDIVMEIVQNRILFIGLVIFQLVAVVALSGWVQRMSVATAAVVYALYATLVGLTSSVLFLAYTMESISSAFFVTAIAFAGLSAYGYMTRRDLGPVGTFCIMGLFGLIGIMILGMFIPSMMGSSMQFAVSVAGILIFSGLTAYDTQRIKSLSLNYSSSDEARKGAIYGALVLYLDFINLFFMILNLMGDRR